MAEQYICEGCQTIYAEYVNGCPKCWDSKRLHFSVVQRRAEHAPLTEGQLDYLARAGASPGEAQRLLADLTAAREDAAAWEEQCANRLKLLEAKDAENERLRKALEDIKNYPVGKYENTLDDICHMKQIAINILVGQK